MPPFYFWDLRSSYYHYSDFGGIDCFSLLHLVVLVGFYFVPSLETYFFVTSFCQTYCACGLLSTGSRTVIPIASGVCPLVGDTGLEACVGFLVEGLECVCWWVEPCGRAHSEAATESESLRQPVWWWIGLCPCPVNCLARGITTLLLVACWVVLDFGTNEPSYQHAWLNVSLWICLPPMSTCLS